MPPPRPLLPPLPLLPPRLGYGHAGGGGRKKGGGSIGGSSGGGRTGTGGGRGAAGGGTLVVCESWAQTGSNYMGEDRVAVLLFYHTLCLIHVSKHFTNCALHELFHFHATQFWVTLLYTRVVDL